MSFQHDFTDNLKNGKPNRMQRHSIGGEMPPAKLFPIEESDEKNSPRITFPEATTPDVAYDADVDEVDTPMEVEGGEAADRKPLSSAEMLLKIRQDREHIYELFHPWALKTYADQAKTKTITMRKKARILQALEGKEHSRPDSSKFRFWVKTKGFTTKRPAGFQEALKSQKISNELPPNAILSDNPSQVDLFVASTTKDVGGKRSYRKVAVVEEFFEIIYNVHMELGGRSGMHAGQKRTYRIITETYAFLPREAVTRFLSICPECKKNLRATSPSSHNEEPTNESSSEMEVLNYSSHTESSLEAGSTTTLKGHLAKSKSATTGSHKTAFSQKRRHSNADAMEEPFKLKCRKFSPVPESPEILAKTSPDRAAPKPNPPAVVEKPKIRVNPLLQRPVTPPTVFTTTPAEGPTTSTPTVSTDYPPASFDANVLKSRESLMRYYEFMRRFYAGGFLPSPPLPNSQILPFYGANFLQGLRFPETSKTFEPSQASPKRDIEQAEALSKKPKPSLEPTTATSSVEPQKSSRTQTQQQSGGLLQIDTAASVLSSAINLSKSFDIFRSNGSSPQPPTQPTTSASTSSNNHPLSSKSQRFEPIVNPKALLQTTSLRIPQLFGGSNRSGNRSSETMPSASRALLPPLDLERLKPITSTYLQLTRSMGLTDEDALRFDNLVSTDFLLSLNQKNQNNNNEHETQ